MNELEDLENTLLSFWENGNLKGSDYIHIQDKDRIEAKKVQQGVRDYNDYVGGIKDGRLTDNGVHLSLFPSHFMEILLKPK